MPVDPEMLEHDICGYSVKKIQEDWMAMDGSKYDACWKTDNSEVEMELESQTQSKSSVNVDVTVMVSHIT